MRWRFILLWLVAYVLAFMVGAAIARFYPPCPNGQCQRVQVPQVSQPRFFRRSR